MVTKTPKEIDEMRRLIAQGLLPPDAVEQHIEHEYQQTFGQNYKTDADGNPIEQGRGSKAQPTRGSIDAYIKNQTERRGTLGPEKGFQETVDRMEAELAAFNANKPAPAKRKPGRPARAA
jgi:hypothetical protein